MREREFKIGDRVVGTEDNIKDKKGTIVDIMNDDLPYGVKFDESIMWGHGLNEGNGAKCEYGYGYWCTDENIELLANTKFNIGDRVESTHGVGFSHKIGVKGTIVGIDKASDGNDGIMYGVEFDENISGHAFNDTLLCKDGHGWWVFDNKIKLIEEEDKDTQEVESHDTNAKESLKDLLKFGNVVELTGYGEKRMGIVSYDVIETTHETHSLANYDDSLIANTKKIEKIYENTSDGLKLIWDRDEYVDWSKVEVDTKIQVRKHDSNPWRNRHFAKYEDGVVSAFNGGETSFTADLGISAWHLARLYKEEV